LRFAAKTPNVKGAAARQRGRSNDQANGRGIRGRKMSQAPNRGPSKRSAIDIAGGLFLLAIAAIGYIGGFNLPLGYLSGIGSGLLPKSLAVLVAAFGILLILQGLLGPGPALERWAIRGPFFVLGAVILFALTIRWGGLIIAGPLAVVVSSLGSNETRPTEVAIFAVTLTLLSGLLFKELLNLPIPFDPLGLVPSSLFQAYIGAKDGLAGLFAALKGAVTR
jgi:putative tricarboxylic transport membrane protein